MPHVSIKCYPGKTEEEKRILAERIKNDIMEVFQASEDGISVAIQDVPAEEWKEKVWDKEIVPQKELLYKKPGYTMD